MPTNPETPTPIPPSEREGCGCQKDGDRVIWIAVRRGLLTIVRAIEDRYQLGDEKKRAA